MEAEISAAPAPSSKKGIYIVAAVGVAVISVSAVLVIALQGEPKQPPPIVVNNTQQALPENAPPSNLPQQALTPTPPQPERKSTVPDVMRRANELMINENWEQAIRTLEAGLDTENGNAELKAALDHAENERGTKATFDAANGAQQRGDYMTARELFQQVPDSSMYAQRAQKKLSDPKVKNAKANAVKQAPIAQQEKKKADPVEKATPPPQVKEEPVAVVQPPPPTQGTPREQAKKLYEQGTKSLSQNRLKESIEYFLEATRTDPKFARPHRDLGIAHARAGNGDAAVEHYRLYLQLFPSAPDAESVKKIISDYEAD